MIDFGLSRDEFESRWFERDARLTKGAVAGAPFGWTDLDELLHHVPAQALQVFDQGLVPEERYLDRYFATGQPRVALHKRRFHDLLRGGATLVVNRCDDHSAKAARLCGEVASFAGAPAIGNAYLSFGGSGTFGKHWDTHDVFAIQLIGRKRWQVFGPTFPLPLAMHRSESSGHGCPPVPVLDFTMEQGDLLYLPRGWWHQAMPLDGPSLHLSVGTYPPTVHDYLMWVCARRMPSSLAARASLAGALDADVLRALMEDLGRVVTDPAARAEFARELAARERSSAPFDTELLFDTGSAGVGADALVRLNGVRPQATGDGEVAINGARLRLHPLSRAIVGALADGALSIEALCARASHERPEAVHAAVLDLARHELVSIERRGGGR